MTDKFVNRRELLKRTIQATVGASVFSAVPIMNVHAESLHPQQLNAVTSGNLKCLKTSNTGTGRLEAHILSASSNYQNFSLETGTPLSEADANTNYVFVRGCSPDILGVKVLNTATGSVELHILSASSSYQRFTLETAIPLALADASDYTYTTAGGDLVCLKAYSTGTGKLEVHILSAASNYQQYILHTPTPITADDALNYSFTSMGRDLVGIKKFNTGTGRMEVHILTAASNYQQFSLELGTPLSVADAPNYTVVTRNNDLVCVKHATTGTGRMEVHILTAASNYQQFSLEIGTPLSVADASNNYVFVDANS